MPALESDSREEGIRKQATKSVTFRLDSSIVDELQQEADHQEISFNVLVNQILRRYRDWDRYETKLGMMPVPKAMLTSLIDRAVAIAKSNGIKDIDPYRDQIIRQAVDTAFGLMKDEMLYMRKSYNLWTLLSVLQEYMKVSGINSDHKIEPGGRHVFVIQHELGENWSLFTKGLMQRMFEKLARVRAEINTTPNTVTAEVILR